MEDINGFSNLIMIDGRSFDGLKERMIQQVQVPAQILHIGLKPNGFPYAVLKVSVVSKAQPSAPKKSDAIV